MKYSFMSFSCPQMVLPDILTLAESLGYSGFEPRSDANHAHGIELDMTPSAKTEILKIMDNSPVKLACLATSVKFAGKAALAQNVEDAKRAVSVCVDLHIPTIRMFGGPIDEGDTREASADRMADALDRMSDFIGSEDITLCVETHDSWCNPKDMASVMKLCRGHHAAVNWDIMHTRLAAHATEEESAAVLAPYIRHVHIHGGTYTPHLMFQPIGTGEIDHSAVLRELFKIGYQGYLSGEWIGWDEPNYLETEIKTMKRLEEEIRCSK